MGRSFCVVALGLSLAACATQNKMDAGLSKLVGQDIHAAISRLGNPDSQPSNKTGDKNYVWTVAHDVLVPIASTQATGAIVGGRQITATSTSGYAEEQQKCTIQLVTDQTDQIKSYQWSGEGCMLFYGNVLKS